MSDIDPPYCTVLPGSDEILPHTVESAPYNRFFFNVESMYTLYLDEEEVQTFTREGGFLIPTDKFVDPDTSRLPLSHVLSSVGIDTEFHPFIISEINKCACGLLKNNGQKSIIPVVVSLKVDVPMDEDHDYDDDEWQKPMDSESAVEEILKKRKYPEDECAICREEMNVESNQVIIEMPCFHNFHKSCLIPWLRVNDVCPFCRYKLP